MPEDVVGARVVHQDSGKVVAEWAAAEEGAVA
jgi:hypothetical protein